MYNTYKVKFWHVRVTIVINVKTTMRSLWRPIVELHVTLNNIKTLGVKQK